MIPISSVGVSTSFRCDSLFVDPFVVHFETELSEDFVEGLSRKEKWERREAKVQCTYLFYGHKLSFEYKPWLYNDGLSK